MPPLNSIKYTYKIYQKIKLVNINNIYILYNKIWKYPGSIETLKVLDERWGVVEKANYCVGKRLEERRGGIDTVKARCRGVGWSGSSMVMPRFLRGRFIFGAHEGVKREKRGWGNCPRETPTSWAKSFLFTETVVIFRDIFNI